LPQHNPNAGITQWLQQMFGGNQMGNMLAGYNQTGSFYGSPPPQYNWAQAGFQPQMPPTNQTQPGVKPPIIIK
jgi:hypothetical protein